MDDEERKIVQICISALLLMVNKSESEAFRQQKENMIKELLLLAAPLPALPEPAVTLEKEIATGLLKFSMEELSKMPISKTFKKEFIANGLAARIIQRPSGKNGVYYEIRYRRNGYNITASSTDLGEAKRKFLEKCSPTNIGKYYNQSPKDRFAPPKVITFGEIAEEWLRFKQGKCDDRVLYDYRRNYEKYIKKPFEQRPLPEIRTGELDDFLKTLKRPRLYEDLRTILNSVFKYAAASGIMQHNPVTLIPFVRAERTPRRALTEEEIKILLTALERPEFSEYRQPFLAMLYFGLRPCELDDETHFEGDFLIARNRKRHKNKVEYKKIPVHPCVRDLFDREKTLKPPLSWQTANKVIKRIFGKGTDITQYFLRHTFSTVCQMYVRQDIVNIWLGDAPDKLIGKHYTHFPDDFMLQEMKKVVFLTLHPTTHPKNTP